MPLELRHALLVHTSSAALVLAFVDSTTSEAGGRADMDPSSSEEPTKNSAEVDAD